MIAARLFSCQFCHFLLMFSNQMGNVNIIFSFFLSFCFGYSFSWFFLNFDSTAIRYINIFFPPFTVTIGEKSNRKKKSRGKKSDCFRVLTLFFSLPLYKWNHGRK